MKNRNPERSLATVVAAVLLITALGWRWSSPVSAQASSFAKRVLVLHWYNREFSWNVEFDQSFKTYLGSAPAGNIEFYQEYLESDRFPGDNQAQLLRDYLRKKYADHPIDVVVATSDVSLEFLLKDRSSLFPGLPIVFVATQLPTTAGVMTEPGLTGIINISTHRRTVDLALRLHPATEQVFVISGTLEHDKRLERLAREELQGYEGRVQIAYLTDLPPAHLVQKMESLPKRSIVLYVWEQSRNEQGKLLESVDLFALIAPHAHVPIYGMLLPLIGRGVVGGYVNTGAAAGTKVAEIVLRIETGTRAVDIPVERAPAEPIFDWRELRRWGITENKLPRESLVRFREPTLWEQYKWRILGIAVLLLGQTMLIWGLLIQRRKKRKLYTELQLSDAYLADSKAKLEEAQRITHVGYWEWDISTGRVNWSDETYRIYGMRPQERSMDIAACQEKIYPEDWQRGMEEALGGGTRFNAECRVIRPTGEVRIAHFQGDVRRDASGRPYQTFGTVQDITDRKRAEEELQRSQFYLSEGQRLAHMGSWALNPSGVFEYWSRELFQIYGLDPQKGAPTLEQYLATVHPQDRDFMAETVKRMCEQNSGCDVKKRIIRPDGAVRYVRCVGIPVLDNGVLKSFLGTAMDITEQELLNQELELRQADLAEAQKLTHTGSWACRLADGKMEMRLSEEWYRIYGFDPVKEAPTWEEYSERVHPEDRPKWKGAVERAIVEKADYDLEFRILFPDGKVKWIHAVGHPVLSDTGDLQEFVGSSTDITERKHAEEALRSSKAYLLEAQRLTHTGSCAIDGTSRETVYWSDEMFRLFGFDQQQGLPTFDQWLQRIHPEDRDKVKLANERTFIMKVNCDVEFRIAKPDGTVKHIHGIGHPVLSATGELVQVLGTMVDVTERKSAEQERERLRQLEADLEHMNRVSTMGEMAASLAHEIKQPITAAVSNAEACLRWLARDQPDMLEMREAATETVKEARRAAEIINRTRSLFQKEVIKREAVDVNEVINQVASLVRKEAARYSISLRTEFGTGLPKVSANHVQLQQVLINLMLNGIEAMKDAPGELIIKSKRDAQGRVLISVSDTGVGLPAENADKIFNAFFTTKPRGTGMGLAISRSIVESHGGRLWAQANLGPGATFNFTLPHEMVMSA